MGGSTRDDALDFGRRLHYDKDAWERNGTLQPFLETAEEVPSSEWSLSRGGIDVQARHQAVVCLEGGVVASQRATSNDAHRLGRVAGVAAALEKMGFAVTSGTDLNSQQLNDAIDEFAQTAAKVDVALFYYSGHAFQLNGENYLVPLGVEKAADAGLLVDINKVLEAAAKNARATFLVILDACRSNPYAGALGTGVAASKGWPEPLEVEAGLADVRVERNAYIAYAAAPGKEAFDGEKGKRSPFTRCLLRYIRTPGLELDTLMRRVRQDVSELTKEAQNPFSNSGLRGEFYFRRRSPYPIYVLGALGLLAGIAAAWGMIALESLGVGERRVDLESIDESGALEGLKTSIYWSRSLLPAFLLGGIVAYAVKRWDESDFNYVAAFLAAFLAWSAAFYVQDRIQHIAANSLNIESLDDTVAEFKILQKKKGEAEFEKRKLGPINPENQGRADELDQEIATITAKEATANNSDPSIEGKILIVQTLGVLILAIVASALLGALGATTSGIFRSLHSISVLVLFGVASGISLAIAVLVGVIDRFVLFVMLWMTATSTGLGYCVARYIPGSAFVDRRLFYRPASLSPVVALAAAGLVSGLVSALIPDPIQRCPGEAVLCELRYILGVNVLHGMVFGLVIAGGLFIVNKSKWYNCVFAFLMVELSWIVAVRLASTFVLSTSSTTVDYFAAEIMAGIVGAGGCLLGCTLTKKRMFEAGLLLLTLLAGALATIPDMWFEPEAIGGFGSNEHARLGAFLLFVPWQAAVAACIGYGIALPPPEPAPD